MKKLVLVVAVMLGVGLSQVNAQTNFTFGAKANANLSNFIIKEYGDFGSQMRFGGELGGFMKIEFTDGFALQPELQVAYTASKVENIGTAVHREVESWGIELPIYAVAQFKPGNGGIAYIGVGPYIAYGFSSKDSRTEVNLYDVKADGLKPFDFGASAMGGYEFPNGIQINVAFQMGVLNLGENLTPRFPENEPVMRSNRVSLGVGYRF